MSYSLDIYYKKLKPTKDFISFASFVSFFPQLVAGPIERASNLLPQILNNRIFKYEQAVQGLRLILYGMFKKVVIADSLAPHVDTIFQNYTSFNGGVLLLGLVYFSFQIYCDFSGYSDIAIGTSKLFGFELMSNFKFPYFSRDIGEFWRRWHVSLSTWFRDYLYIPLGGSKGGKFSSIRNIFIIFSVSGFWHGANWTFIAWGLIHAMLYIPLFLKGKNRQYTSNIVAEDNWFPSIKELLQMCITFSLTMIAWAFFRSESLTDSFQYIFRMVNHFSYPSIYANGLIVVFIFILFDWTMRRDERNPIKYKFRNVRYFVYLSMSYLIFSHFKITDLSQFMYFQF
jgi:D-alanyl-lipoteichoic acid acyltransferase DltB (MBOAT superfamily)